MALFAVNPTTQISYDIFPHLLPATTVFLHGNLASNHWWMPTVELLKSQALGSSDKPAGSMICLEFRGCGKSSVPQAEDEVTMQNFAHDFISLIRSMKIAPVNIVGHSAGGLIAAMMLATAPELFNRAYLLDPVGAEGVKFDPAMIQAFEGMKQDKELTAMIIGSTIHNNNPASPFFKDVLVEDAFKAVKAVGHLVLKALDGLDIRDSLRSVENPVKVVHGEHDVLLSKVESEKLAKLFKNGQFETLVGCGHCANIENPKLFLQSMNQFLFL